MVESKEAKTETSPSVETATDSGPATSAKAAANGPGAGAATKTNGNGASRAAQPVLVRKQSSATGMIGMVLGALALVAALGYPMWTPFLYGPAIGGGPIPGDRGDWLTAPRVKALLDAEVATLTRRLDDVTRAQSGLSDTLDMARLPAILMISSRLQHLLVTDQPYDRDLRLFRMVAGDGDRAAGILAALSDHAETGVPTRKDLADAFGSVVYAIILAEQRPEPFYSSAAAVQMEQTIAGIAATIARLRWSLQGVPDGDDNASVAIRAESMVSKGDLIEAVAELDSLSSEAATLAADWVSAVKARMAMEQAAQDLEAFVIGLAARMT